MRKSQDQGSTSSSGRVTLDAIDRQLIAALQVDGRRSYTRLAAEIGVSESVVRYRVQRLERDGVLQIVGIADPLKIGFDLMALIGIRVAAGRRHDVLAELRTLAETSYVASLAGSFDAVIEVVCRDTAHFNELLTRRVQGIDGVVSTDSFLILEIEKMAYGWGAGRDNAPMAQGDATD
jgi:Lrp/AsnC family transcriptional regulator for asnA, asnC and gidA